MKGDNKYSSQIKIYDVAGAETFSIYTLSNNLRTFLNSFFSLNVLVYDFVMAYVVTIMIGKTPNLLNIKLPSRRMSEYKYGNAILVDDYAHHPTEIKALCESIRLKYPDYKINVIFQPHTYTRTLRLKKEFKKVLRLFAYFKFAI